MKKHKESDPTHPVKVFGTLVVDGNLGSQQFAVRQGPQFETDLLFTVQI